MRYHIYYNDGVNEMALLSVVETLAEAKAFVADEVRGRMLVDNEHPCSEDVFSGASVASVEVYDGECAILDEDGCIEVCKDPVFSSPYFYTE